MTTSADTQKLGFWNKVYNGDGDFQIVPHRKRWFTVMGLLFVFCVAVIGIRGFSLGIDFEGGTRISIPPSATATEDRVAEVFQEATGIAPQSTTTVGSGNAQAIEVTSELLNESQIRQVRSALFEEFKPTDATGQENQDVISDSTVSESWGSSITKKMVIALGVFLLAVFLYIALRLERDMALAAIICLIMDMTVVAGIYALIGFEVSPATVIGLLTILAYSLYDTVVVFDKVQENTTGLFNSRRSTYEEQVNLAVNQTIMRSLNTSIFSLVPIASLLIVAVYILGVGTLKDLALVQFFGVIAGTFSSIFFAAGLLVFFKMRSAKYRNHAQKVLEARAQREDSPATDATSTEAVQQSAAPQGRRSVQTPTSRPVATDEHTDAAGDHEALPGDGKTWRPGM
ncbi:protein translocase subunit SecF [Corynebacterium sp. 320]|uniref:Protein-export membrane protein SecF n=1 Tax=Corynebacterium zhongnanshanii TaxID=2768834 RepID=A0ABQ6VG85_9CORY|nr:MULTISPECIES: protein translocase subunit SecF [Corynebacterium]KAB1503723.1 protein translocase subunit SecF [Corynebacterium sp. 320]KAB1553177.1 protein translocase subunit SecF [Corynebacterium sp. 321]KAB1553605.1 protein translocase subunit SecF [Corynebacterium sp. 319]KAB3523427.1 protein translocase subunit SecF [Corynebacterium zhongnanshanii]KAB3527859.1 protein translocase subunit SecF [Corynebacterium sp. 250]